jgi:hypothetical protein
MATNYKGRTGTNWRTTGRKTTPRATWTTGTTRRKSRTSRTSTPVAGYTTVYNQFQQKINSYRMLCNQTKGHAKTTRPTQTTLTTFANWIEKGANIYTITPAQLNRWAGKTSKYYNKWHTPTNCRNFLHYKFGKSTIKAVARTKTGSYMVACSPTYKGKPFNFPR